MKEKTWSSRLSELPGVEYLPDDDATEPPKEVRAAAPEALRHELGGEERISLQWTTPKGATSASPAAQWFGQCYWKDATPEEILGSLYH